MNTNTIESNGCSLIFCTVAELTIAGRLALQAKVKTRGLKALEVLKLQQASQDALKAATEGHDVEVGKGGQRGLPVGG